ncbi:hypothetical protein AWB79_07528 [Caballeronia hypogeia]|uniref:Uncharacterized protein n=1 Tax=Caballeronia hypogeia TaxID=1777140 RepID=A0A158DT98_9BURK|nr:hypothetical protein AWB79_07528 [Caballeronia hypogeia]
MAAGLRIWSANGELVLDASHRVMRIIDVAMLVGGVNGQVQSDLLKQGGGISFQPNSYIGYLSGGLIHPTFAINTSTGVISWTWAAKANGSFDTYQEGPMYYFAY